MINKKKQKKTDWDEKIDKLKMKFNRHKDGYKKHKKRNHQSW
jgi:hypothetical protein